MAEEIREIRRKSKQFADELAEPDRQR